MFVILQAMFTCNMSESQQQTIPLKGVEPAIAEKLLDYAYTAEVIITQENVQSLLSAANLLEMLNVRDACCQVGGVSAPWAPSCVKIIFLTRKNRP